MNVVNEPSPETQQVGQDEEHLPVTQQGGQGDQETALGDSPEDINLSQLPPQSISQDRKHPAVDVRCTNNTPQSQRDH